jgi:hypothetical protein
MKTTFAKKDPDPALTAWLNQFDTALRIFDGIVEGRMAAFPDGDRRRHCEAWVETPGHICTNLAKNGTPFCRTHQKRRRPARTFGAENPG